MFGISFGKDKGFSPTDGDWEKVNPIFPKRLIDGTWSYGPTQIWRRRSPDGYQYKQDDATWEDRERQAW